MVNAKPFIHSYPLVICTSSISNALFYHQCRFYSTTIDSLVHTSILHSFALLFFIELHIHSIFVRSLLNSIIINCSLHSSVGQFILYSIIRSFIRSSCTHLFFCDRLLTLLICVFLCLAICCCLFCVLFTEEYCMQADICNCAQHFFFFGFLKQTLTFHLT